MEKSSETRGLNKLGNLNGVDGFGMLVSFHRILITIARYKIMVMFIGQWNH